MEPNTNTTVVSNSPLIATLSSAGEPKLWRDPGISTGALPIAQLAQQKASELDLSSVSSKLTSHEDDLSKADEEEQQHDFAPPSNNVSAIFQEVPIPEAPHPSMTRTREIAFIFITCFSQFLSLSALNQTVAPVLVLADYFHIEDYGTLSWFSAAFSMSVGTFILPAGMSNTPFT
jgi:hypothetical protein